MRANVGMTDRLLRAVLGLGLLIVFFVVEGQARYIGLLGAPLLVTAMIGWCPAYLPFGFNSCKRR